MKLWHDDIRPSPPGWTWARTNAEAKRLLETGEVTECSLDHDLGLHDVDVPSPEVDVETYLDAITRAGAAEETGLDLVHWMVETGNVPVKVTIHSWNPIGARNMAARLNHFGHDVTIAPFVPVVRGSHE